MITIPKDHLSFYEKKIIEERAEGLTDDKVEINKIYLKNCSDDELVFIHGIAELELKKRGILENECR